MSLRVFLTKCDDNDDYDKDQECRRYGIIDQEMSIQDFIPPLPPVRLRRCLHRRCRRRRLAHLSCLYKSRIIWYDNNKCYDECYYEDGDNGYEYGNNDKGYTTDDLSPFLPVRYRLVRDRGGT